MSYDFRLFLPQAGLDPLVTAQSELTVINSSPADPTEETRKRAIADALMLADAGLKEFQLKFEGIAKFERITIDEAKLRYRYVELNGPRGGPGIQITLYDDNATLTVPYWHRRREARLVFARIWGYLKVIQRVGGYQIYDPQMERLIDLEVDLAEATKCYSGIVSQVIGQA